MIVFEEVEPSSRMQVALSNIFGPLKDHPVPTVPRVDKDAMPGVIDMRLQAGRLRARRNRRQDADRWLPWHFDHCYNNELNYAGILRAVDIAPEGGMTGFADGIALYKRFFARTPRRRSKGSALIYSLDLLLRPYALRLAEGLPRARRKLRRRLPRRTRQDPAARRPSRRVDPQDRREGAACLALDGAGIKDHEDPEGDALLEAVCQEVCAR